MAEDIKIADGLIKPYSIIFKNGSYEIFKTKVSKRLEKGTSKPTGETYERLVWVDRAQSIESCIEKIIRLRVKAGNKKVTSLVDYYANLRALKQETEKIFKAINQTDEERFKKIEEQLFKIGSIVYHNQG